MNHGRSLDSLRGKRVTVMGLGRFGGGIGVTRWLCSQGAKVTVSDRAPATDLAESIKALGGCDVTLHLGGHDEADFLHTDLLVVNPAVDKNAMPILAESSAAGVRHTTEINLFIQRVPARVIGITGSVGKSTVTAMVGQIVSRRFKTHVGGNIGKSLLQTLDDIAQDDIVVLELSSFQLEDLPLVGISPQIALVTNLTANHLDRHGTMEAYGQAKQNIFRFQKPDDVAIFNSACPVTAKWAALAPGRVDFFDGGGMAAPRSMAVSPVISCVAGVSPASSAAFDLALPGAHNQANAQAAWAVARQLGIDRDCAQAALKEFTGLPHRLQFVCERKGITYYNDSKCTTPGGAIVAIESFAPRSAVIIVGGYDKHVSFDQMGAALARRAKAVVAVGATREQIVAAIEKHRTGPAPTVVNAADFDSAIAAARGLAVAGETVLLSPACASYDMFKNYEERGQRFVDLVTQVG